MKNLLIISLLMLAHVSGFSQGDEQQEYFKTISKKNSKVYLKCNDKKSLNYAKKEIQIWGFWIITEDQKTCDFILNINIAQKVEKYCFIEFINPKDMVVVKRTKRVNTASSLDFNLRRAVIRKVFRKEIKPIYK